LTALRRLLDRQPLNAWITYRDLLPLYRRDEDPEISICNWPIIA
jgi:hypothetical protein